MNRIRFYIAAISLMAILASCSDDFLLIDHNDIVTPDVLLTEQKFIEKGLNGIYDLFYAEKAGGTSDLQQNWNLKPQMAISNYPSLDLQPNGWDVMFSRHEWKADNYMFGDAWKRGYNVIDRANRFLANLEKADLKVFENGETTKKIIEAEARAIRAYFYSFLCQNWGGVPMLLTGDTYSNTPEKGRGTTEEAWNAIIQDLEFARANLAWTPWKGNYGRITLGMVKAYLAQAYMYNKRFADAKKELKDIIDNGPYELNPCFAHIHIRNKKWQKESVWEVAYNQYSDMGWGATGAHDDVWWPAQMFAADEWGGWGPAATSYECVWSFEPGDKRLEYSVVQYGDLHPCYPGGLKLGHPQSAQIGTNVNKRHAFVDGDNTPNNYLIKVWKEHPSSPYSALPVTYMRLAAVYLNYAECCFETKDDTEGWKAIGIVRNRAWGNLEVGFTPLAADQAYHPVKLNTALVEVPDAETYYKSYKRTVGRNSGMVSVFKGWMQKKDGSADSTFNYPGSTTRRVGLYEKEKYTQKHDYKPYTIPVWKVALIMERRHEFLGEHSFWQDLCRMGVAGEYLDAEYPQNNVRSDDDNIHTIRAFPFDPTRMLLPIPTLEMETNTALKPSDQNPGY